MGIISNTVAAVGIAGTITLGALTQWGGGAAITNAKALIMQQADSLGIYHTNEGKLLNKISDLKTNISNLNNQITQLQSSGTADSTQIAALQGQVTDLTNQLNKAQSDLTAAQTNGNALAQRVDDLQAQLDQANKDAADLQTTTTANATVATSDQTAVDQATGTTTTTSTPPATPPADTTTTTTTTVATETQATGSREIDMLTGVPYTMTSDAAVKLNTNADGSVYIYNIGDYNYTAVVNGTTYTIPNDGSQVTIGNLNSLDQHNLTLTKVNGTPQAFWLVKK